MKFLKQNRSLYIICFTIFIMGGIFVYPFRTALVFHFENTNRIQAILPINKGEEFTIIFTHSIHLTDVTEKYRVLPNLNILQYEIVYEQFGIGMPSNANEEELFVYENGKYHIKNMNNIFPSMNIRNGKTISEHRLVWDNGKKMVEFNDYFEPGAWYKVEMKKLTVWQYLKGVKIHE
ncbi:DUF1850 domain-containing protein [Sutcliffiella cohnii]|uniref:DUF1850 domain-containing protein n=1 Tax=Sutcliffiella cohnii TaxID=33932 RepID=A0A223KKK0_9BACI|nr:MULTISPECIES: DUF1850 domain-containing protein [Sutcliffiella]AST89883.1 hypothetical protein BC6307_00615 [Sutcliffiella cohnii]WBL15506.1 DUF1850 domain-containing protein [Sutcliffiella sp. NC1]